MGLMGLMGLMEHGDGTCPTGLMGMGLLMGLMGLVGFRVPKQPYGRP